MCLRVSTISVAFVQCRLTEFSIAKQRLLAGAKKRKLSSIETGNPKVKTSGAKLNGELLNKTSIFELIDSLQGALRSGSNFGGQSIAQTASGPRAKHLKAVSSRKSLRNRQSRLRSRNTWIDKNLREQEGIGDSFADLEDFIVPG